MPIGELCVRQVVVAPRETSVLEAARLMRQYHVGDIVVTDDVNGRRKPVGIVTDRDLVLEVMAPALDATALTAGDIMSGDVITVTEDAGVLEAVHSMRAHGVRRVPVVNRDGLLVGIVSVDDLVELLAEELSELAKLVSKEQKREAERRP